MGQLRLDIRYLKSGEVPKDQAEAEKRFRKAEGQGLSADKFRDVKTA
jgi:hypothetical protein